MLAHLKTPAPFRMINNLSRYLDLLLVYYDIYCACSVPLPGQAVVEQFQYHLVDLPHFP